MKVNINGRGIIPGLGVVPPVYGQEMSEKGIARLLNFNNIKVYDAKSGAIMTKKNYKNFFTTPTEPVEVKVPEEIKQVETPVVVTEESVCETVDESLPEIKEEPTVVELPPVDDHDVSGLLTDDAEITLTDDNIEVSSTEEVVEEISTEEETVENTEVVEEVETEEQKPSNNNNYNNYNNNKNRNKNKNRHH